MGKVYTALHCRQGLRLVRKFVQQLYKRDGVPSVQHVGDACSQLRSIFKQSEHGAMLACMSAYFVHVALFEVLHEASGVHPDASQHLSSEVVADTWDACLLLNGVPHLGLCDSELVLLLLFAICVLLDLSICTNLMAAKVSQS